MGSSLRLARCMKCTSSFECRSHKIGRVGVVNYIQNDQSFNIAEVEGLLEQPIYFRGTVCRHSIPLLCTILEYPTKAPAITHLSDGTFAGASSAILPETLDSFACGWQILNNLGASAIVEPACRYSPSFAPNGRLVPVTRKLASIRSAEENASSEFDQRSMIALASSHSLLWAP